MKLFRHQSKINPTLIAASIVLSLTLSGPLLAGIIVAQVLVTDTLAVRESVQESVHTSISSAVSDALAISESVQESVHTALNFAVSDALAISESVQESVHTAINSAVSDVLTTSESVLVSVGVKETDISNLSEFVAASADIGIAGTAKLSDSLTSGLASSRIDPVGLDESVGFLVLRSGGGNNGGNGTSLPAGGSDDDDDNDRVATFGTDLSRDLDGDNIRDGIDGRFVNGRFISQRGVFSAEFTDQHLGGSTFGRISNRGGLVVELAYVDDPDTGLLASASSQGETATLVMCGEQFHLNLTAGDTVLMTCGSLTVTVLAGQVEMDLGPLLGLTVSSGTTAKVTELGNGRFAAENPGTSGLVIAIENGKLISISSGERVEIGQSSATTPRSTPEPSIGQPPSLSSLEPTVVPVPGISTESSEAGALAPSGTPPAEQIITTAPIPRSPTTPLPQSNAGPESEAEPLSFPPDPGDSQLTRVMGAVALGALAGAAFIALIVSLFGLVRRQASGADSTRGQ